MQAGMSLQPVSAVSKQNLSNKSRVRPGSLEFVVMFRAPGGIFEVKRSLGTTPCVAKDSSCHIMQGDFGEAINGHKEYVLQYKDILI